MRFQPTTFKTKLLHWLFRNEIEYLSDISYQTGYDDGYEDACSEYDEPDTSDPVFKIMRAIGCMPKIRGDE